MLAMYDLLSVFSVNDVLTAYYSIVGAATSWLDCHIEVMEHHDLIFTPDVLVGHAPVQLVESTRRAYASLGTSTCAVSTVHGGIASGLPHSGPLSLKASAEIRSVAGLEAANVTTPFSLATTVLLLDRIEDLAKVPGGDALWAHAQDDGDYFLAIAASCVSLSASMGKELRFDELPNFRLGSEFLDSLKACQAAAGGQRASVVLETCTRVLLGVPKYKLKVLGRPNQQRRSYDNAGAFRTQVYKGHEALRLMFWQTEGSIEFANIANKLPVYIEEGSKGKARSYSW